ncbi:MAG: GNAT family N-acetyltransferase [Clostridia bacterium]
MKYFKKLEGENIYLSPKSEEDVEVFTKWINDFETTDYIGRSAQTVTIEAEKEYLQSTYRQVADFVIVKQENDQLIGSISLKDINHLHRTATLGIFIGDKDSRSQGYGTEAICLLLDYAFSYLNLNNIMLWVMEFNERAICCYKKCGFQEVGRRRKCHFLNGHYYDKLQMDILAEEFTGKYIKNKCI